VSHSYYTHAPIDAVTAAVRAASTPPTAATIKSIHLKIADFTSNVCNIPNPTTGLEAKFSLRHALAVAALGRDSGRLATWTDGAVEKDEEARKLVQSAVKIDFVAGWDPTGNKSEVEIQLVDGTVLKGHSDSGLPARYVIPVAHPEPGHPEAQSLRIAKKFKGLAGVLGEEKVEKIIGECYAGTGEVKELVAMTWL
jgi:hypothetical protein